MSKRNKDQFEADQLIDSLYQDNAGEQPPVALDNLILAKARGQTVDGPKYRKTSWHIPVVLCMVPAVALGLVLKLGNFGRGGDMSLAGADTNNVYSTDEFVLHIPRASDAITRPEKPVFSADSGASNDMQAITAETQHLARAPESRAAVIAKAEAEINVPVAPPELAKRQPDTYKNEELVAAAPWSAPVATICNDEECMVSDMDVEEGMQANRTTKESTDDSATDTGEVLVATAQEPATYDIVEILSPATPAVETETPEAKTPTGASSESKEEIVVTGARIAGAPTPDESDRAADMMVAAAPAPASTPADIVALSKPPTEVSNAAKRQGVEKIRVSYEEHYQECPPREERGEICTDDFAPVCAERDTGVRCVLPPCNEATEIKTYSNACNACADLDVYGYFGLGACDDLIIKINE